MTRLDNNFAIQASQTSIQAQASATNSFLAILPQNALRRYCNSKFRQATSLISYF